MVRRTEMENKLKITVSSWEGCFHMSDMIEVYRNDPTAGQQLFEFLLGFVAKNGYTLTTKGAVNDNVENSDEDLPGAQEPSS